MSTNPDPKPQENDIQLFQTITAEHIVENT